MKTFNGFLDWNPAGGMFSPYQSDYGFRGGLQKYGVRLGYEHWCYHPIVAGNMFIWKVGGQDTVYIDFSLKRLFVTHPNLLPSGLFLPFLEAEVSYSFADSYQLWNWNNYSLVEKPDSKRIQVRALAGFKAWILWTEAEVALIGYPGIESIFGTAGSLGLSLRGGIDLAGIRIGYEYDTYIVSADAVVPELLSHTVYIEFDLDRIVIENIRRENRG